MACPLITVALCKQCVYICVIATLSFSSFSNCESHRETSFPTMAASDGFSDCQQPHFNCYLKDYSVLPILPISETLPGEVGAIFKSLLGKNKNAR